MTVEPVVSMRGVVKNYNALRPLRIAELSVAPGARIAVSGIDALGAEVMLNLVTGASLPDRRSRSGLRPRRQRLRSGPSKGYVP